MKIEVRREAPDGLSAKIWEFDWRGDYLVLTQLMIGSRPSTRHKFKGDKWSYMDERSYHSKLSRPTSIPDDVLAEAMSSLPIKVSIGWPSLTSAVVERSLPIKVSICWPSLTSAVVERTLTGAERAANK